MAKVMMLLRVIAIFFITYSVGYADVVHNFCSEVRDAEKTEWIINWALDVYKYNMDFLAKKPPQSEIKRMWDSTNSRASELYDLDLTNAWKLDKDWNNKYPDAMFPHPYEDRAVLRRKLAVYILENGGDAVGSKLHIYSDCMKTIVQNPH